MNSTCLKNSDDCIHDNRLRSFYISAKQKLNTGNIEAAYEDFSKSESLLGCSYCRFIQGKIDEAVLLLNLIKDSYSFGNWLLCLIGIIKGDKIIKPTYFQIRNFYEPDLNILLKYQNYDFVKAIFMESEYLSFYNKEVYKFAARVCMDNSEYEAALSFLKKSTDIFYRDPEVHFMLGETYMMLGNKIRAVSEYLKSNEVTGGYYPAAKKLTEF